MVEIESILFYPHEETKDMPTGDSRIRQYLMRYIHYGLWLTAEGGVFEGSAYQLAELLDIQLESEVGGRIYTSSNGRMVVSLTMLMRALRSAHYKHHTLVLKRSTRMGDMQGLHEGFTLKIRQSL